MIKKSTGQTTTERFLANLCENTFLGLWSYPNTVKDDKKEFCDLLAIFEDHMFIFFDREKIIKNDFLEKTDIAWNRWYKSVIEAQKKTCHGAERYIRNRRKLFLDTELDQIFPIEFDPNNIKIHKILIAHGAKEACKMISSSNINGSLCVSYKNLNSDDKGFNFPFTIDIDRSNPVHVFDSHNLPILLSELDTFSDFKNYIVEKEIAIKKYQFLAYCGEEDLLAHFFLNFDPVENKYTISTTDEKTNAIMIGEGEWNDFIQTSAYKSKKKADEVSYLWDRLIQKTSLNALNGVVGGNANLFTKENAIYEMAKEPRLARRAISKRIIRAISNFPTDNKPIYRFVSYIPSLEPNKAYIFLQLKAEINGATRDEIRELRQYMLGVACGSAKNKFMYLQKIVGIATDPPKLNQIISEDFILLDCSTWSQEQQMHYDTENEIEGMRFFLSDNKEYTIALEREFPDGDLIPDH
jgi:hypothetical protein